MFSEHSYIPPEAANFKANPEAPEQEKQITVSRVNADDLDAIAEYYMFEVEQGFSDLDNGKTIEKMSTYRQGQMRDGKLSVAVAREGDKLVGTGVVILENGTMGKEIKPNEAWHAGFVTDKTRRGQGIGEKILSEQDEIAIDAGKEAILTRIEVDEGLYPSMRACMKHGYELDGIDEPTEDDDETDYRFRKELAQESPKNANWTEEVLEGRLALFKGEIDESSPNQILIDVDDPSRVKQALGQDYKGVYLLRPQDFEGEQKPIDKNMIVFVREQN